MKWDGKKISKPGVYDDIPMEAYHGDLCVGPSISSSDLRTIFTQSPAHYYETSYLNTEKEDDEDDDRKAEAAHFILGRAAHHLLLGEDDFSTLFVMRPEKIDGAPWQGNRTACKQWLADQAKAGRTVLTPAQIKQIRGMARSLAKHPLIEAGILNGQVEKSMVWRDKETGIWLKSRPDVIPTASGDIADLKTTTKLSYDFDNDASKMRYDMQAALAKWGMEATMGLRMNSFSFIPVLTKPPHSCDVLTLQSEDIMEAEKDLRTAIRVFANCIDTNNWFGPSGTQSDARFLVFSKWHRERAQLRRDFLEREIAQQQTEPSETEYLGTP